MQSPAPVRGFVVPGRHCNIWHARPQQYLRGSPSSSGVHADLARMTASTREHSPMGTVVFLYRSLAYRNAAADLLRKARKLPRGAERSAVLRYARALKELAQTEAWLEGRSDSKPQATVPARMAASL
jgi:hypothetical protein